MSANRYAETTRPSRQHANRDRPLYSMKGTSYKNSKVALGFLGKVARDRSIREIVSDEFEWVRIIINAR
jgi:hypothetical protein